LEYAIGNSRWILPFFGFFVKIIDFGHSEIPEEGIHSSIKRPLNYWAPDHITFITSFEDILAKLVSPFSFQLEALFQHLNPARIGVNTDAAVIREYEDQFPQPYDALHLADFSIFEIRPDPKRVIAKYSTPE
jgi:hypothetical protein